MDRKLLLFGRFGGLSEDEILAQVPGVSEVVPLTQVENSEGFGGLELFSRSVHLPPADLNSWENLPKIPNTFSKSRFYNVCRLLHELHFKRHFINSGWQPMSLSSLEGFNLSVEISHHLIAMSKSTQLVFEAVPHNTFDTILYFVGRHLGLECLVFRDVGFFGGTRIFRNPLDDWPHSGFTEALVFPLDMRVSNSRISDGVESIRFHTAIGHDSFSAQMLPSNGLVAWSKRIKNVLAEVLTKKIAGSPATNPALTDQRKNPHHDLKMVFEPEIRKQNYSQKLPFSSFFALVLSRLGYARILLSPNLFDLRELHPKKYIYFSLAHQPEQTTSILGFVYEDHHYFLRRLLWVLPSDYVIVVRDHPLHDSMVAYPRSRSFLKSFMSSSRVRVADQQIPIDSLLEGCQAVALVNGSAGFEALSIGKPVIYGGSPDYVNWAGTIQLDDLGNKSHAQVKDWIANETNILSSLGKEIDDFSINHRSTTSFGWASMSQILTSSALDENKERILTILKFIAAGQGHEYRAV